MFPEVYINSIKVSPKKITAVTEVANSHLTMAKVFLEPEQKEVSFFVAGASSYLTYEGTKILCIEVNKIIEDKLVELKILERE